ncbi:hypothetical protein NEF87_001874 [Candidatus Lokiarchaeum ossiferum]|uniref:Uncharacterized protein n=1 Tax=Candidatus Lokiarchaeum ossiferum TaxID=2951803 RepID=A0ABY6HSP4_9ARCH|nr:hypothetical protein NEF87_001874 [Candidatus Lokiarchaeum sp. B-35]
MIIIFKVQTIISCSAFLTVALLIPIKISFIIYFFENISVEQTVKKRKLLDYRSRPHLGQNKAPKSARALHLEQTGWDVSFIELTGEKREI